MHLSRSDYLIHRFLDAIVLDVFVNIVHETNLI